MKRRFWQFSIFYLVLVAQPVSAFTISPMSLTFLPSGKTKTIKVKNPSDQAVEMTLRVFSWQDSLDLSALEKTSDVIAMPPIFEVPANGEQTVRIALREPLEIDREKAYRLLISEVPSEVIPSQAVSLNLTVNLPIFVRPESAEPLPAWTIEK
ncbi:MAG: fimbrial biogenesis chaperone, partial [Geminicoccaceae bacterium]